MGVAPKPISRQFPTLWQELGMHCLSAQLSFPFGFSAQCCCSLCVNSLAQVRATFHRLPRVTSTSSDTPPQITHDPTTSPPIYNPSLEDATQISHLFCLLFFCSFSIWLRTFSVCFAVHNWQQSAGFIRFVLHSILLSALKEIIRVVNQGKKLNSPVLKWISWLLSS